MPYINGNYLTPEKAASYHRCPECGRSLEPGEEETEILNHWPRGLREDLASPEAIARAQLIRAMYAPKE